MSGGNKYLDIKIDDPELLKLIKENLQHKFFSRTEFMWSTDSAVFNVKFSDDFLFKFEPNSNGHIDIEYKDNRSNGKIDEEIISRLKEIAENEYMKNCDTLEIDKLIINSYDGKLSNMVEETDSKIINEFLSHIKNAKLEQFGGICYTPEAVKERIKLEKSYYEIIINKYSTLYADEDFENIFLEKKTFYGGLSSAELNSHFVLKVSDFNNGEKLLDIYKTNENGKIIDCGFKNEIMTVPTGDIVLDVKASISADENSLSNEGVRLILRLEGDDNFSRVRDNDFILYKDNNGIWEELHAKAEPNENTMNKLSDTITEKINWTEKYGELEKGIYKLERKIFVSGVENLYFVTFEIK